MIIFLISVYSKKNKIKILITSYWQVRYSADEKHCCKINKRWNGSSSLESQMNQFLPVGMNQSTSLLMKFLVMPPTSVIKTEVVVKHALFQNLQKSWVFVCPRCIGSEQIFY